MAIDVGLAAIVRDISKVAGNTYIVKGNPANANGTIGKVEIYAKWQFTGLQIGVFYSTGTNKFSTRSTVTITTGVVTAGYHIYDVSLDIQTGDYIGFCSTSGEDGTIYGGYGDCWGYAGDLIPCTNFTFNYFPDDSCGAISLYGYSFAPPTVTTQVVTNKLSTTATGNGNITSIGSIAPTKRGVCYNLTGSPTVADSKSEETGSFGTGAFTRPMTGLLPGTLYHVKAYAYNSAGYGYGAEVDFTTLKVAPTVTTQVPTDVLTTTVTANGNITASGGENATIRGFKYGLTQANTWDAHTDGSFPIGAFTKDITGLNVNTEYWIRAYATNSIGTSYGVWVKFQTAAAGTTPTGTNISICSDYSGMTYILNASLTDDGNAYESYFVISTDLADKQGLHFKKRLEDLYSYFEKKDSGTCKIYVKRDNEITWQYAGEISMTGDEDIIIKHLPSENQDSSGDVDFLAKHFLIKFTFSNDFEFIGLVTESILIGVR
ncbi:MAG: hypothetical protein IMZ64_08915 [Bacteroidetes bacterium]|nr:hypothetical protein [Bacteroidota bacterium]